MGERYRSEREEKLLEDLLTRYQTLGIVVYGEIEGAPGTYARILVKSDGTVKVEGVISGSVDISDDWTRQLGQVDIQRYLGSAIGVANPLHSQIVVSGAVIDPRSIRALVKTTDELYSVLRTDAGAAYDARQIRSLISTDIITAYGSLGVLQQRATSLDLYTAIRQGGSELSTTNPLFAGIVDASGNRMPSMDASSRPGYVDVISSAARLLGIIYGDQGQLAQRATTRDALVQLRAAGTEYAYQEIRWGIPREPAWINGSNQTAPGTTTDLVSKTVTAAKTGRIFGWQIISPEANEFILNIGGTAYRIGALAGAGVICVSLSNPMFDGITATTTINIRVATAGSTGKVYRADLLYDEA